MTVTDIFISYVRDDEHPSPDKPGQKGFVTFLDDAVRCAFTELGPERPKISRDTRRIANRDQLTPEIENALRDASLLLVVLSSNWIATRWCRRQAFTSASWLLPGVMWIPTSGRRCCKDKMDSGFTFGTRIPTKSSAILNFLIVASLGTNGVGKISRPSRFWYGVSLVHHQRLFMPLPAGRFSFRSRLPTCVVDTTV